MLLDSGKIAAEYLSSENSSQRAKYLTFQLKVAKEILGLSSRASSDGTLGEIGWNLDVSRSTTQLLQTVSRFARSPPPSLPAKFYANTISTCRQTPNVALPYFLQASLDNLDALGLCLTDLESKKGEVPN